MSRAAAAVPPLAGLLDADEGARLALEELSDPVYRGAQPDLLDVVYQRVMEFIADLADAAAGAVPGGWWVLGPLLAVLAALAVALVVRLRPSRHTALRHAAVDSGAPLTAADHRAAADRHAAAGEFAAAVRERLRAVSRDLEDRAVIPPRPGRTATELAAEAGAALPERRDDLGRAARVFNDIAYGERPATADDDLLLRGVDARLAAARTAVPAP
ncbi:DUF4129 domain-containing protein [Nocardiopsis trehalosi]|uniref:DUF4129 domain-containing protein n=1 Tax=Nocardiopsis trehalosi TaxID=109329 RepID=UPI000831CA77|nr:DUF4129 domain-containing protein [Nocardiopsis trehalosi]